MNILKNIKKSNNKITMTLPEQSSSQLQNNNNSTIIVIGSFLMIALISITALVMSSSGKIEVIVEKLGVSVRVEKQEKQ